MSTVPMQQVCPERAQNTARSDKQQTMQANLVSGLYIQSTGSHEVLHHGQLTLLSCPVQGCKSIVIIVKEVAPHLGDKVLSNGKMTSSSTQMKCIASTLHWAKGQAHNWSLLHTITWPLNFVHTHTFMHENEGRREQVWSGSNNMAAVTSNLWSSNIMSRWVQHEYICTYCYAPYIRKYYIHYKKILQYIAAQTINSHHTTGLPLVTLWNLVEWLVSRVGVSNITDIPLLL